MLGPHFNIDGEIVKQIRTHGESNVYLGNFFKKGIGKMDGKEMELKVTVL